MDTVTTPRNRLKRPLISVVICTYNRAALLRQALNTLCAQTLDKALFEVIVVDNNSADNTAAVVWPYDRVRYVLEKRQGLSYARNRGWLEARGDYIAYVDDECKVPAEWLANAVDIIDRLRPAALGGPFWGYYNCAYPAWWQHHYTSFSHSDVARPLGENEYLSGGNMFIARNLLEALGGFNGALGMNGQALGYGEETDFQQRLRAAYPESCIYFDPKLHLFHLVRPEKMNLRWALPAFFISGRFDYQVFHRSKGVTPSRWRAAARAVRLAALFGYDFAIGHWHRDREQFPFRQNYWYEVSAERLLELGKLYEQLRTR